MKLSFIFELLLIFILVAFAASAVISPKSSLKPSKNHHAVKKYGHHRQSNSSTTNNRFCSCKTTTCNCCRDFNLPLLNLKGPGCASLQYLQKDQLAISMSFNERVLTNTTIKGRKPQPICMPLPGGVSKFCGRVYNIGREGDEFNACLGLELRALSEIEAAIRVSCFKFGPKGLRLAPPQPLPPVDDDDEEEDEDDDDDDDDFDFDGDDDDVDYTVFDDDFIGQYFQGEESEGSTPNKKVTSTTPAPSRRLTRKPVQVATRKPVVRRRTTRQPAPSVHRRKTRPTTSTTTEAAPAAENEVLPERGQETSPAVETAKVPLEASTPAPSEEPSTKSIPSTPTAEETTVRTEPTTSGESEEDPVVEVVGDVLDDEISDSEEASREETTTAGPTTTAEGATEESKEVFDDIVDGVVETFAGGDSDEAGKNEKGDSDEEDRKAARMFRGSRQSRDMWLERLHW